MFAQPNTKANSLYVETYLAIHLNSDSDYRKPKKHSTVGFAKREPTNVSTNLRRFKNGKM